MKPTRSPLSTSLVTLALVSLLGACASTKLDDQAPAPVVTRSPNNTTWTSPNADPNAPASTAATAPQSRVATVDTSRGVVAGAAANAAGAVTASGVGAATAALAAPSLAAPSQRVVFFDYDSFVIRDEFKPLIEGHAKALAGKRDRRVVVEGHTDERGGREYNLALGQKRAEAVLRSLALLGVSESQVEAVSFGKERPLAQGENEQAWAQNRRAELKDR